MATPIVPKFIYADPTSRWAGANGRLAFVAYCIRYPDLNGARDEFHLAATAQNLRKLAILIPAPAPASATEDGAYPRIAAPPRTHAAPDYLNPTSSTVSVLFSHSDETAQRGTVAPEPTSGAALELAELGYPLTRQLITSSARSTVPDCC